MKRRPEVNKWGSEKIRNIVASPRMPNPEDPSRLDIDVDKTRLSRLAVPADDVGRAEARPESEACWKRLQDVGEVRCTAGCPGCNKALPNKPRRGRNKECRERIKTQVH